MGKGRTLADARVGGGLARLVEEPDEVHEPEQRQERKAADVVLPAEAVLLLSVKLL